MVSRSIIFVFTLAFSLAMPPVHGKNVPVWRAKMVSPLYSNCIVKVGQNVAIFDTGIYKYVFNPPNYQIFSFANDENHTYCVVPLKTYLERHMEPLGFDWIGKKRLADVQLNGRPCQTYRLLGSTHVEEEVVVTSSMGVNRPLEAAICNLFQIPTGLGLPLKIVQYRNSRKLHQVLLELVNLKQTEEPELSFNLTHTHKRVENQMQMLMTDSDGKTMALDDIFEQPMDNKDKKVPQPAAPKKPPSK